MKKIYLLTLSILLLALHPLLAQTYQQTQKLTASDPRQDGMFGSAMSAFGNYVVIGAPYENEDETGDDQSGAYIFEKTTSGWKEVQKLKAGIPASFTPAFGKSVHTDGTRIIVGAQHEGLPYTSVYGPSITINSGAAYIFEKTSSGWSKTAKLTLTSSAFFLHFGSAVAISGNRALVGAFGDNAAYFFEKTTSGWQQVARFSHYKNYYNEDYGSTVALSGDYAIVGHSGNTSEGLNAGAAYLYERTSSGWQEVQMVVAPDAKVDAHFGASVAINGTYAVVGKADPDQSNNQPGAVYIFERTAKGWINTGKLTASDGKANDWFGRSVSLSGNQLMVSAPGNAAAYIFEKTDAGWQQTGKAAVAGGSAVAIANNEYFVGNPGDATKAPGAGAAYVFAKAATTPGQSIARFTLINAKTDQPIAGYEDLQDGAVIDLTKTGLSGADKYNQFNIDIITSPAKVGSVKMVLTGPNAITATQNVAPYALFNDNSTEGFLPASLPVGSYTLTATPYTESLLKGTAGTSRTIRFTVVDPQEPPTTNLIVNRLVLIDADTDKDLLELTDGATVNPASYNMKNFNIRADVPSVVRSVSMVLSGKLSHTATESKLPFALYGDDSGNYRPGGALLAGSYTLTVTPYSSTSLGGEKGQVKTIQFTVVDQPVTETPPAITFTLINADTDQDLLTLSQNKMVDLTAYNTKNFNIRANTQASAVSVSIELKGAVNHSALESKLPYALYGDASGDYNPGALPEGQYTLTATPYTERYGKGSAGTPVTVAFTVIRSTPQPRVNAPATETAVSESPLVREEKQQPFNVYPNPTEKDLHVVYRGGEEEVMRLSVYDIMGQLLKQVSAQGYLEQSLDLGDYPAGVYMAVLEHGGQRTTKRFYIRR